MCGILIVDDDASIRFAMTDYFSAKGHRTHSVASAEEVESHLAFGHYAIVITDLCLTPSGGAEGLDIVRMVSERHRGTMSIVLTAYGSQDSEATARRYGASAFLHKPQPMADVLAIVSGLLPTGRACSMPGRPEAGDAAPGAGAASCVTNVFQSRDMSLSLIQPKPADRQ